MGSTEFTAWAHDSADSNVYLDSKIFPNVQEGDFAELYTPPPHSNSTNLRRRNFYFQIKHKNRESLPNSGNVISVSSKVLSSLEIRPRSPVKVRILRTKEQRDHISLDVVEIGFRGIYLTRNDHYKIAKQVSHSCVHQTQSLDYLNNSVRLTINTLFRDGKKKFSGYISENTRLIFRSDSSRVLIFIQMSAEMWNFDETGDIMFHRLVNSFIPEMLNRWHTQGDSHLVSIVLFTAVSTRGSSHSGRLGNRGLKPGYLEEHTRNFYRVVVDSVHISRWSDIMDTLRVEFERFPSEVLEDPLTHELVGYFVHSTKSNILEAFSLATTLLTSKFADKDFCRTGVQAIVVTAGPGCFDVDMADLYTLSRRLLGVEIGIELVCLAKPPLHVTPLFRSLLKSKSSLDDEPRVSFTVPTWINMSFWDSPDSYMKQWIPQCRIYDLQMVGLIENQARAFGLRGFNFDVANLSEEYMNRFDSNVFKSIEKIETQKKIEAAARAAQSSALRPDHLTPLPSISVELSKVVASPVLSDPKRSSVDATGGLSVDRTRRGQQGGPHVSINDTGTTNDTGSALRVTSTAPINLQRKNSSRLTSFSPPTRRNSLLSISPLKQGFMKAIVEQTTEGRLPEYSFPSMWRVLPHAASIDHPTRVQAYGRWANVYPPKRKLDLVSWHSLKSPASLPVTSESFPNLKSFKKHYKFQFYDVTVEPAEMELPELLDEMIGLRLQMGFQISVAKSAHIFEESLNQGNPNSVVPIIPRTPGECLGIRVYLTRTGLVHRLAVDDVNLINVRLYSREYTDINELKSPQKNKPQSTIKVKTRYDTEYLPIDQKFLTPEVEHLNWSMLDQQIGGADDPLLFPTMATSKFLTAVRYVIIPQRGLADDDKMTSEEKQVEGITRFVRLLLRRCRDGEGDKNFLVQYYTGKITDAVADILAGSSDLLETNRFDKNISLKEMAAEMQGKMGVSIRDRRWHWRYYKQVFIGREFVVWLLKNCKDIKTPDEAESFGQQLMDKGLFRHTDDRHPFLNGHYFYEMCLQYKSNKPKSDNNNRRRKSSAGSGPRKSKINVTESFVINMDPQSSTHRLERARISVDKIHNPKNGYHVLVEWLNATPRLIDNLFSGLGRGIAPYGVKLVQVPVADVTGSVDDSPFRTALRTPVEIEIEDPKESRWFRHYLLRRNGFILDIHDHRDVVIDDFDVGFQWGRLRSHLPQYIHESGYVLVQLQEDGSFYVTANTLQLSRSVLGGANAESESEMLMSDLHKLCHNTKELQRFLNEGRSSGKFQNNALDPLVETKSITPQTSHKTV